MNSRGLTLIELVVALAVLGAIYAVVELAVPAANRRGGAARPVPVGDSALRAALAEGRAITLVDSSDGVLRSVTAFPDGRVYADSGPSHAPR